MKKIFAAIVTYNNVRMLKNLLDDIAAQSRKPDAVIIIDNASSDGTEAMIATGYPNVIYRRLAENRGSAGGYHEAVKQAVGYSDYVWTLDDDVRLDRNTLEALEQGCEQLAQRHPLAAVRSVGETHPVREPTQLEIVPWRGTLFTSDSIKKAGLPREDYFLYGEDLEYSLRLKKLGYVFFWVPASRCMERRQGKTNDTVLGKRIRIYPSAFRLYYAFRNECSICLQYHTWPRLIKLLLYALKVIVYVSVTEKSRGMHKVKAIAVGLFDGCAGRLGKNKKYLP